MKTLLRAFSIVLVSLAASPAFALQMGKIDYSKAVASVMRLRGNVSVLQVRVGDGVSNIGLLAGPEGYLLVDHPEVAANPLIQRTLDNYAKLPVRFLINTHWHYDHVGGNEIYAPNAVVIAHENVRKRMMTQQKPWWSPTPIGPYPERAWPRITFQDSLAIHFDGEDVGGSFTTPMAIPTATPSCTSRKPTWCRWATCFTARVKYPWEQAWSGWLTRFPQWPRASTTTPSLLPATAKCRTGATRGICRTAE